MPCIIAIPYILNWIFWVHLLVDGCAESCNNIWTDSTSAKRRQCHWIGEGYVEPVPNCRSHHSSREFYPIVIEYEFVCLCLLINLWVIIVTKWSTVPKKRLCLHTLFCGLSVLKVVQERSWVSPASRGRVPPPQNFFNLFLIWKWRVLMHSWWYFMRFRATRE